MLLIVFACHSEVVLLNQRDISSFQPKKKICEFGSDIYGLDFTSLFSSSEFCGWALARLMLWWCTVFLLQDLKRTGNRRTIKNGEKQLRSFSRKRCCSLVQVYSCSSVSGSHMTWGHGSVSWFWVVSISKVFSFSFLVVSFRIIVSTFIKDKHILSWIHMCPF